MTYTEAIKSGFRLVNSRWQLIVIQTVMMLFNCIGFFIMVGIPLGIAFIIFGLDLTGLSDMKDVLSLFKNPAELISKYFGLILIIIACFLLYVLMVTTVGLYVFSGSVGIIGRSVREPSFPFSMRGFFAEARRLFMPMMWYSVLIGLIFLVITFALGLFGGGIAAIVSAARGQDSTLALFLGIFFSLLLVLTGLSLILGTLAVTVYGIAILFFGGEGSLKSFTAAFRFLWSRQQAFWLYVILLAGYIFLSFFIMLIVYPFNLLPIIGTLISFPFQIMSYIAQGYLGLIILAVVFNYYYETELKPAVPEAQPLVPDPDITDATGSTSPEDISGSQAHEQEPVPPQTDETAQN
ncbi:MAG: hypothetical protein EPN25_09925 [Nitrospirae bacterium]|nr:MAG: hypothetical protein EPN25_09925 [Nitrospirota bacterium]